MGNAKSSALTSVERKRIYVIGPSSTGKTTLCDALARRLHLEKEATYITEVARHVIKERGYTRDDVQLLRMQEDIMNAQIEWERKTRDMYPVQVFDRSAIDPLVYAKLTGVDLDDGTQRMETLKSSETFHETLQQYRKPSSVFVLLGPVQEWLMDDGVRHLDDQQTTMGVFKDILRDLDIEFLVIDDQVKDLDRRVEIVVSTAKLGRI